MKILAAIALAFFMTGLFFVSSVTPCFAQKPPRIQIEPLHIPLEPYVAEKLSAEDREVFQMLMDANVETVWMYLDQAGYNNCFINELHPIFPDKKMVGRARTMRYMPLRPDIQANLGQSLNYISAKDTEPGDILVFDAGGEIKSAVTGDVTTALFAFNGGVGIVCDGALRDIPPIKRMGIQVFQRAGQAGVIGPFLMSIDYQVPVRICNATVIPGDILLCDAHGILVIPADMAKELAIKALEFDMWENFLKTLILRGETVYDTETQDGRFKEEFEEYKRVNRQKYQR